MQGGELADQGVAHVDVSRYLDHDLLRIEQAGEILHNEVARKVDIGGQPICELWDAEHGDRVGHGFEGAAAQGVSAGTLLGAPDQKYECRAPAGAGLFPGHDQPARL